MHMLIKETGKWIIILISVLVTTIGAMAVDVTTCGTYNASSTTFDLTQNITGANTCITLAGHDQILDCHGYNITYGTASATANYGIIAVNGTTVSSNNVIKNCIVGATGSSTNRHAIRTAYQNNITIQNNTAQSNGTSGGVALYMTYTTNSTIENNTLTGYGSTSANHGIYATLGVNNNVIRYNNITANKTTTTNYGIYFLGSAAQPCTQNNISQNNISTNGNTGATNHGIYLTTAVSNTTIDQNNIIAGGSATTYGIYVLGVAGFATPSWNSTITNNNIIANGTTSARGIWVSTDSHQNNITGNIVNVTTGSGGIGIEMLGVATGYSNNNIIQMNNVSVIMNTSGTDGYGIYGTAMVSNNTIDYNNVTISGGGTTNYGMYITGAATTPSWNNNITFNNISTNGGTTGSAQYGIYLYQNVSNSRADGNNISTAGTTTNHGIYVSTLTGTTNITANNNTINTTGTGISNHGIYTIGYIDEFSTSNNNITAKGSGTEYGIAMTGAATTSAVYNGIVHNNSIFTNATSAGSNIGIWMSDITANISVKNNTISGTGNLLQRGIVAIATAGTTGYNHTIDGNNITLTQNTTGGTNDDNYGIEISYLSTNDTVINNIINMSGFNATTYGIYSLGGTTSPTDRARIENNTVTMTNALTTLYGIYASSGFENSTINNNRVTVLTNSASTRGIVLVGTADATRPIQRNNTINNNNITMNGTSTSVGLYIGTNFQNSTVNGNNVDANGTTTTYGIYGLGTTSATIDYNQIMYNNVTVNASTGAGYGLTLSGGANENNATDNNITVNCQTACWGAELLGTATIDTTLNRVSRNNITVNATGAGLTTYGVYLYTNVLDNYIRNNTIKLYSNATSNGIYLGGVDYPIMYNTVTGNSITVMNTSTIGATNNGINVLTNANNNNISNNNIYIEGNSLNAGIKVNVSSSNEIKNNNVTENSTATGKALYFIGRSEDNTIENNNITSINGDGIRFVIAGYRPEANIIKSNTVEGGSYDLYVASANINDNQLINQNIGNYTITGLGGRIIFEQTSYGKLTYTQAINGTGDNLSEDVIISNQTVSVNDTKTGLNKTATLIIYNVPTYENPTVYRNGVECDGATCSALVNLGGGSYTFNVTGFSNYTILENVIGYTYNCTLTNTTTFLTTEEYCDILNKTRNSLMNSSLFINMQSLNENESAMPCNMNLDIETNTGDYLCDLLRTSKYTLHALNESNVTDQDFEYTLTNGTTTGRATSYNYTG